MAEHIITYENIIQRLDEQIKLFKKESNNMMECLQNMHTINCNVIAQQKKLCNAYCSLLPSRSTVEKECANVNSENEGVFPIPIDKKQESINENSDDEVVPPSPIKKKTVSKKVRNNKKAFSILNNEDEELSDDLYVDSDETFCSLAEEQLKKKNYKKYVLSPSEISKKVVSDVLHQNSDMDRGKKNIYTINNESGQA